MKTLVGRDQLRAPRGGTAVTIGTFDGVHLGHRALIARTVDDALARAIDAAVVTWDRHPNVTLRPDRVPPLLTTPERKAELLAETGAALLVTLAFDEELSRWPPERFATDVLAEGLDARRVFVGEGWRFGHKAAGDPALLKSLGRDLGFEVEALDLAEAAGAPVSSSRVRHAVASGDMELACALLGRPFDIDGVVVRGDDRGASLGFPTANIAIDSSLARPSPGVYAARARARGKWFHAAVNIGVNPTFAQSGSAREPRIEAYLIDYEGDLYGEILRVEFLKRLRDEVAFDSVDALIAQIAKDVEATRALSW